MELESKIKTKTLKSNFCEVRLQWSSHDSSEELEIDLDLQCLIMDDLSQIEDVVYYNQTSSTKAGISLSEDQRGGSEEKQNEVLKINFASCKYGIKYLAILVCSHDGITLNKLKSANIDVIENDKSIFSVSLCGQEHVISYLPFIFTKQYDGTWILHQTKSVDKIGKTFTECEAIVKQGLIQCGFDEGLFQEANNWLGNKVFDLKKDDILVIPNTIANNEIFVGLGWDTQCDIDSSILTFDKFGKLVENIYFGNLQSENKSIKHEGDNLTGVGDGDDEVITINLNQVDERVETIWSVITIYSTGKTFSEVSGTFSRLVDKKTGKEFCRYDLSDKCSSFATCNSCIMACIKRYKNNCWAIQPKGFLSKGKRYANDLVPSIQKILENDLSSIIIMQEEEQYQPNEFQQIQQQPLLQQSQSQNIQQNLSRIFTVYKMNLYSSRIRNFKPYIILDLNKKTVMQTSVVENQASPFWVEKIQLNLKQGDLLEFKAYSYNMFCFDTFLGQSKIQITNDILNKVTEQQYEIQIMDSNYELHPSYQGQIIFSLLPILQSS